MKIGVLSCCSLPARERPDDADVAFHRWETDAQRLTVDLG